MLDSKREGKGFTALPNKWLKMIELEVNLGKALNPSTHLALAVSVSCWVCLYELKYFYLTEEESKST